MIDLRSSSSQHVSKALLYWLQRIRRALNPTIKALTWPVSSMIMQMDNIEGAARLALQRAASSRNAHCGISTA